MNSDKDVMALLDTQAELKLRTPFNIYVGGNILDRGITIPNLIAFYYGRNPERCRLIPCFSTHACMATGHGPIWR